MPSVLTSDIMQHFQIGPAGFGQFCGIYYLGYSIMQIPLGLLIDRYGPRKVVSLSILLSLIGLIPLVASTDCRLAIASRGLLGIGSSAAILGVFKVIRMLYPQHLCSRMLSWSVTVGLLGALYGGVPVSWMVRHLGFEPSILVLILMGLVLAALTYFSMPDAQDDRPPSYSSIRAALFHPQLMRCCFFAGLMVGPLEGFADVWGTPFLRLFYGLKESWSSFLCSLVFIGMCVGAPLLSRIAQRLGALRTCGLAGLALSISFAILLSGYATWSLLTGVMLLMGVACAYQIQAIAQAASYLPANLGAFGSAIANMVIMLFGYAFHSFLGGMVAFAGGADSVTALQMAMTLIPCTCLLGSCGFFLIELFENKSKVSA